MSGPRVMWRVCLLAVCGAASVASTGVAQPTPAALATRIECTATSCRADVATYVGWRVFHAQCATCHAADALGSSFAPDLTQRMRGMDQREFFAALDDGYLGPNSAMRPRGRDPAVAPYYRELWAYLAARRDGRLPPGPVEPSAD